MSTFGDQLIWGLDYDSDKEEIGLPTLKLVKAGYVGSDPRLDPGCSTIELLSVQILGGCMQYWSIPNPALK